MYDINLSYSEIFNQKLDFTSHFLSLISTGASIKTKSCYIPIFSSFFSCLVKQTTHKYIFYGYSTELITELLPLYFCRSFLYILNRIVLKISRLTFKFHFLINSLSLYAFYIKSFLKNL